MNKAYIRINWENYPSDATPINKVNLNRLDSATDILDDRVITLDTTKATKTEVATLVSDVTFEESTGIITITKKNGSKVTLDTQMEKIAVNFDYDPTTEKIMLTLIDGTKQYIDLSALITQYEFLDTEKLSALFGKIAKWLSDLKTVAFTGSYSDLTDKPTIPSNTWRPVQDNLTTASSTDCLSANMGKYLYETKANSNHTHDSRYYTETEVNNLLKAKMPVSGGTFTGAVGFANGVWNPVGDDCCVGDFNIGGCVAFKSLSAALTGIALVGAGSNAYGRLLVQNDGGDMYLATNGAFYVSNGNNSARAPIYASAFTQSSSRRVKKNIEDMTETEAKKLLDVEVKSYDYINPDMPDGCFGCIAEDMAKIIPSCVNGDVDCADDDVASIQGIGIDYSKLVPHLIKMVQIQQAQIDAQQEQIDKLAAQLL